MSYDIAELNDLFENLELKMEDITDSLKGKYLTIRAGRANPHILNSIRADYYGTPTPLNQMANITVSEARVLTITVWDQSSIKAVEKAIYASDIGITPVNDGKSIRLVFPELTEERRKLLVKEIKTYLDNSIIGLRNQRRDANDVLKRLKKDSTITEDDLRLLSKDVDDTLAKYIKVAEELFQDKEKEIMSV